MAMGGKEQPRCRWRSGYHDAVFNSDNGLFYVLRFDSAIYTLDLNGHSPSASRIMHSAMPMYDPGRNHDLITMYLVKTPSGNLLQAFRWIVISLYQFRNPPYTDDNEDYTTYEEIETFDVQVFKVDLHGQKLDQITTLGDHSLFLGYNNSTCISTKDSPMLEPNLFYLMDNCKHVYEDDRKWAGTWVFSKSEKFPYTMEVHQGRPTLDVFPFLGCLSQSQFGLLHLFTRLMMLCLTSEGNLPV
ncbi:uncharacterized protein [Miscanthus floridulus]|uniref:uncharacterized protein n=1 Tax=Miscanthus floridulus TaxID=154761 RepID=UPI00345922A4